MKTLKIISAICLFGSLTTSLQAQDKELNPVTWEFEVIEEATGRVTLNMTATMEKEWHLYATVLPSDEGPIATLVEVKSSDAYKLIGDLECPKPITKMDENFGMEVNFYEKEVQFKQALNVTGKKPVTVTGSVEFMCCNNDMCLPPKQVPIKATLK